MFRKASDKSASIYLRNDPAVLGMISDRHKAMIDDEDTLRGPPCRIVLHTLIRRFHSRESQPMGEKLRQISSAEIFRHKQQRPPVSFGIPSHMQLNCAIFQFSAVFLIDSC
jgi:hypothetical protein